MARGLAVVLTVGAGVVVGLQAPINSRLGRGIGNFQAAALSFAIGLAALLVIAALAGGGLGTWSRAPHQPWWALLGGFMGAIYVSTALVTVRTLGTGALTAATIAGQLGIAVVIDQFGLLGVSRHPVTLARVVGLLLLAAGVYLVVRN